MTEGVDWLLVVFCRGVEKGERPLEEAAATGEEEEGCSCIPECRAHDDLLL